MKNEKLEHLKQYLHQSFQGIDSFLKEIIYPIFGEDNVTSYNQNLIADNPELSQELEVKIVDAISGKTTTA